MAWIEHTIFVVILLSIWALNCLDAEDRQTRVL
jgi:hypothetical protein